MPYALMPARTNHVTRALCLCAADIVTDLTLAKLGGIKHKYVVVLTVTGGVYRNALSSIPQSTSLYLQQKNIYTAVTNCMYIVCMYVCYVSRMSTCLRERHSNLDLNEYLIYTWYRHSLLA